MSDVQLPWQNSLKTGLVSRLIRPIYQPGVSKISIGLQIINRCDRTLNRHPLLNQQMQRWQRTQVLSTESIPVVYAQPRALIQSSNITTQTYNPLIRDNKVQASLPPIQKKVNPSPTLDVSIHNLDNIHSTTTPVTDIVTAISVPDTPTQDHKPLIRDSHTQTSLSLIQKKADPSQLHTAPSINQVPPVNSATELAIASPNASSQSHHNEFSIVSDPQDLVVTPARATQDHSTLNKLKSVNPLPSISSDSPITSPILEILTTPIGDRSHTDLLHTTLPTLSLQSLTQSISLPLSSLDNTVSALQNLIEAQNISLPVVQAQQVEAHKLPLPVVQARQSKHPENQLCLERLNVLQGSTLQKRKNPEPKDTLSSFGSPLVSVQPIKGSSTITPSVALPLKQTPRSPKNIQNFSQLEEQKTSEIRNPVGESAKIITSDSPPTQTFISEMEPPPSSKVNVDAIANQVEQKLMRRIVIQRERRGKLR